MIYALNDKPYSDLEVRRTFSAIKEAVSVRELGEQGLGSDGSLAPSGAHSRKVSLKELTTGGPSQNFRRTVLGIVIQCFQQITGINLIT